MLATAHFRVVTTTPNCFGLIITSPDAPDRWFWTAKLIYNGELDDAWKSDSEFSTVSDAIRDCYSFLRSMAFHPVAVSAAGRLESHV